MEVKHWKSPDGTWFREMVDRNFLSLAELEKAYKERGHKTWINIYDHCEHIWMLSIEMGATYGGRFQLERLSKLGQ